MKKTILFFSILLASCAGKQTQEIRTMERLSTASHNDYYVSNRAPLQPLQFIKLPAGSIEPEGWIRRQIELQKDGLCGHLGEISAWLQKENNAWLKNGGEWGWEEVPYWLRGYGNMAYALRDETLLKETKFWIEAILSSQRADGNFGPVHLNNGKQDFWPNMIVLWIMQSYHEYTNDNRVIDFMTRYCHYLQTVPDDAFLSSYWENSRGGDNLWSVVWLYNRMGDESLLRLAEKIHRNTADWTKSTQLPNWHNVNVAQCFREPATYFLFTKDSAMLAASYNVQSLVRRAFGQVPGGMFGADENARIGFFDPRQGTETCGFVEQMASDEIMLLISGDPYWADHLEDVAFNSYPASLMPDYRALRYLTCPNMAISDSRNHHPGLDNSGPFLAMNPFSSRCCQHNHGFGWPYYVEHLVLATPDNGVAAVLYNSCKANVKVGDGTEITLREQTNYPFEEMTRFTVGTSENVSFPFYLRIPSWCKNASVLINGKKQQTKLAPGTYACIEREWKDGDHIQLELPMRISTSNWYDDAVVIERGPLLYSLKMDEKWERKVDQRPESSHKGEWYYEVTSTSAWNYSLIRKYLKEEELEKNFVVRKAENIAPYPWNLENAPITIKTKGRILPSWKMFKGSAGPVNFFMQANEPMGDEETIELIPYGCTTLRITEFPVR